MARRCWSAWHVESQGRSRPVRARCQNGLASCGIDVGVRPPAWNKESCTFLVVEPTFAGPNSVPKNGTVFGTHFDVTRSMRIKVNSLRKKGVFFRMVSKHDLTSQQHRPTERKLQIALESEEI